MNPNVDNQEMKSYLLGTLNADRREAFEERILCDREVYEDLLAIEAELIDQYVAGSLSSSEQKQFETHFLISVERQKNLRFGRLLKRYLDAQPVLIRPENVAAAVCQANRPAPANKFFSLFGLFGKGPALAFSTALIACVGVILLLCWLAMKKPANQMVLKDPSHSVAFTVTPGSLRSEGAVTQRVPIPPKGYNLRLQLEVTNAKFPTYKSELFRENELLQTIDELKVETSGEQQIVPLTITGDMLSPGDYQVKLSGVLDTGQDEFIDNYSFRVIE